MKVGKSDLAENTNYERKIHACGENMAVLYIVSSQYFLKQSMIASFVCIYVFVHVQSCTLKGMQVITAFYK